jgi:uridine phosphorylase
MPEKLEEYTMSAERMLDFFLESNGVSPDKLQLPAIAALAFQDDGVEQLRARCAASPIGSWDFPGANDPLYLGNYFRKDVLIGKIPEGAPKAAIYVEFLYCLGVNQIVVTGAAGSLQSDVPGCSLVATSSAIREEGTSYHYLDASRVAHASPLLLERLKEAGHQLGVQIHSGVTLTNDAPFRVPVSKIEHYREIGVLTAEMELATLFAVALCRGIELAGLLVISDTHFGEHEIFSLSEGYRQAQQNASTVILEALCKVKS